MSSPPQICPPHSYYVGDLVPVQRAALMLAFCSDLVWWLSSSVFFFPQPSFSYCDLPLSFPVCWLSSSSSLLCQRNIVKFCRFCFPGLMSRDLLLYFLIQLSSCGRSLDLFPFLFCLPLVWLFVPAQIVSTCYLVCVCVARLLLFALSCASLCPSSGNQTLSIVAKSGF